MSPDARPRTIEVYQDKNGERPYDNWLRSLKDQVARQSVLILLNKVRAGNLGDHHDVGDDVWEFRLRHGPGYRVYYAEIGLRILLLTGGSKKTQNRDIQKAKAYWRDYRRG
jgi:putative addiction module killer protein